jgi:hypothetical protein
MQETCILKTWPIGRDHVQRESSYPGGVEVFRLEMLFTNRLRGGRCQGARCDYVHSAIMQPRPPGHVIIANPGRRHEIEDVCSSVYLCGLPLTSRLLQNYIVRSIKVVMQMVLRETLGCMAP